jgi:hypothetical protein
MIIWQADTRRGDRMHRLLKALAAWWRISPRF